MAATASTGQRRHSRADKRQPVRACAGRGHGVAARITRFGGRFFGAAQIALCLALTWHQGVGAASHNTRYEVLENGLQVVIVQDRRAPTVVQMLWYVAGSMDESTGHTGVAHVLEHLMFKGTPTYPDGVFSSRVASSGGRENAFTSRDYTGYFQQVHKSLLGDIMRMESDRMRNLIITDEAFEKELAVVMEERRSRIEDQAGGKVQEQLMASAYTASSYRTPVIGWMNDLQNMTADDARHWYKTWYAPNNAVLVIAGDVQADAVLALARDTYGKIAKQVLPARKPGIEPPQNGVRRAWVKAPADSAYLVMGYKAPGLADIGKDKDPYALAMLSAVLSSGDTGRLTKSLVRKDRIANSAYASYSMLARGPSLFTLSGSPAKGQTTEALEKALRAQISVIAKDGVRKEELARIKAQYVAGQVYQRDSLFSQVMETGGMLLAGFGYQDSDRLLEQIRKITTTDVRDVAAKYFNEDQLTVVTLIPQPVDAASRARKNRKALPAGTRRHQ